MVYSSFELVTDGGCCKGERKKDNGNTTTLRSNSKSNEMFGASKSFFTTKTETLEERKDERMEERKREREKGNIEILPLVDRYFSRRLLFDHVSSYPL